MQQTVIKVGNSLAVTLPSAFVKMRKIKAGQKIYVNSDPEADLVQLKTTDKIDSAITPEFYNWLNKFNAKYKNALTDLAKK